MTIAIAAITNPDDVIVCVSDRMISFGDAYPADDNAIVKALYLSDQWTGAWATNKLAMILPIVEATRKTFADPLKIRWAAREAADAMAEAYRAHFHKEFVETQLAQYGYKDIHEFRQNGRADLGDHFTDVCVELGRFDLHTQFLLFGHDDHGHAKLFEIESPGHVIDRNALKYGVIGSGYDMAMSSLRWPPPMNHLLDDTIYRLLEAKFSAESGAASGVGKTTTVALRNRMGRVTLMPRKEIDRIREIWKKEVADIPSPQSALDLINASKAVSDVAGER